MVYILLIWGFSDEEEYKQLPPGTIYELTRMEEDGIMVDMKIMESTGGEFVIISPN